MSAPRRLCLALALLLATVPAFGQDAPAAEGEATMYGALIFSKGYVVGSKLVASGLQRRDGDTTWTHLGHNNPRVNAVADDPARPDTLFVAAGNGALRTYDGGHSWRIVTDWRVTEVQDVALDPHAPEAVYLGTAYGVWRSLDGGDTWTAANDGIPVGETYVEAIEVDRTTPGRVLAGTDDGVFVSTDRAHTWTRAGAAGVAILDLKQSRLDPALWLAAAYRNGLWLSRDGGASWAPAGPAATRAHSIHGVALDPHDARRLAAVGWDTGVLVSDDGGHTWRQHTDGLPTDDFYEVIWDANVPGRLWVATLEEGLYYSDDLGASWTYGGLYGTLVFDLAFVYPPAHP